MKILPGLAAICLLILMGGLACESESVDKPAPVTVTDQNSGESIQLLLGQELMVRLPANPSTGYTWLQMGDTPNVVLQVADPTFFEQDLSQGNPPPVGAGGTEVSSFTADAIGQQILKLEYKRPWETGVAPAKTVSYNVTVTN